MATLFAVLGRMLLGAYFITAGLITVLSPEAVGALFAGAGMPPQVATVAGVFQALAGVCLALGMLTRLASIMLAVWTGLALVMLHPAGLVLAQAPVLLMQVGLIGGLLLVVAHSEVWWSLDAMRHRARTDRAERIAERRVQDADLRAERRAGREEGMAAAGVPVRRRWFWAP